MSVDKLTKIMVFLNSPQCTMFTYIFISILAVLNIVTVYLWTRNATGFKHPHITNDISCYNVTERDGLPYLDEAIMNTTKNIFFIETSCRGMLDSIQACAVESAARANPDWQVTVVFAGPVANITLHTGILADLRKLKVNMVRIKLYQALVGTPLEVIAVEDLLQYSRAKVTHASDILRYYLLWKFGGIYIDLDFIVLKSFNSLESDFAAAESAHVVANGALGISKSFIGKEVITELVEELGKTFVFRSYSWSATGPGLITKLLMRICNTSKVFMMNVTRCQGFQVYKQKTFFPLAPSKYKWIYKSKDINLTDSYAIHLWNKMISKFQRIAPKNSLLVKLAKKYCPFVYEHYIDNLGS